MTNWLYIGTNGHVIALHPATGEEVWRQGVAEKTLGTPAYSDVCVLEHEGIVYAGSNGWITALNAHDGGIVWQNRLKGLGYNDVTLCIAGKSIQYVSSESRSTS